MMFEFSIDEQHPCLAGHFPGNPVVPGVVIIDHIINGMRKTQPALQVVCVSAMKFTRPLKPGVTVSVNVEEKTNGLLKVECKTGDGIIVSGQLRVRQDDE